MPCANSGGWCRAMLATLVLTLAGPVWASGGEVGTPLVIDVRHDLTTLGIHERNAAADGETNDSSPIQAAIDHAAGQEGGTVIVPEGVYRVAEIDVKPGVHLVGKGKDKTVFRTAGTSVMLRPSGGRLSNFSAYGTPSEDVSGDNWQPGTGGVGRGGSATALHIIGLYGGEDVHIDNVRAMESRYDCLYTRGSTGLRVTNCHFDRAGRNIVSMVGDDKDFVIANTYIGPHWGLYHFDIEPDTRKGRNVRDGLIVNCTFDGRNREEFDTDTWGAMLIFTGGHEKGNHSVTVLGCNFLDIRVRIRGVFPNARFLYNEFDTNATAFLKVRTNPVGEFEDAVVRGNRFLIRGEPAWIINDQVGFTGDSVFEGNFPEEFNDLEPDEPAGETDWGEEDHPVAVESPE